MEKKRPEASQIAVDTNRQDGLHTFLMAGDTIRGAMLDGSWMIAQMGWNHELGVLETLALGHAYLGACLMSASLKGNDRLRLQVDCTGPIKGLVVEANAAGAVRGFLKNVPIPIDNPLEDFNLAPFFGAGFLSVTRMLEDAKQPFTGRVMMAHGRLAKDLAHYYLTSEQIPTAFSLSIKFDTRGRVVAAGGLFLQALPDAEEEIIKKIETQVVSLPSIGVSLAEKTSPKDFVQSHLADFSPRFVDQRPVEFDCHCNRDQIRSVLKMLPPGELKDIQANGPFPLELRCHHCNTRYLFDQDQIDRIVAVRFAQN
ncbi:Hsp33 family molecular chaperone HslO [Desulfosarcina variabilis]|uniref:Hsp33 family molecular chaperone HslO n=1 Tax=Desulfosarcina variabilis TaxID=2300 RepID=UPI003AFB28DF